MSSQPQRIANWILYPEIVDTLNEDVDKAITKVGDDLLSLSESFGPALSPEEEPRLQAVINTLVSDEALMLKPGVYKIAFPLVLVRPIRIIGLGRVVIEFDPSFEAIRVSDWTSTVTDQKFQTHQTTIQNICFRPSSWSTDSALTTPIISITSGANRTEVKDCSFTARRDSVIKTAGQQTSVTRCAFHGGTAVGGADIYYENGALRGIVHGNLWSTTRSYVISYKTGTDMSEAANGPAAIVQVRP